MKIFSIRAGLGAALATGLLIWAVDISPGQMLRNPFPAKNTRPGLTNLGAGGGGAVGNGGGGGAVGNGGGAVGNGGGGGAVGNGGGGGAVGNGGGGFGGGGFGGGGFGGGGFGGGGFGGGGMGGGGMGGGGMGGMMGMGGGGMGGGGMGGGGGAFGQGGNAGRVGGGGFNPLQGVQGYLGSMSGMMGGGGMMGMGGGGMMGMGGGGMMGMGGGGMMGMGGGGMMGMGGGGMMGMGGMGMGGQMMGGMMGGQMMGGMMGMGGMGGGMMGMMGMGGMGMGGQMMGGMQGMMGCHPGCFPAGTLVRTMKKPRAIEEIKAGDIVCGVDKEGRTHATKVASAFETDNYLFEIDTDSGMLTTTGKQPLCTVCGCTKTANSNLQPGDELWRWENGVRRPTKVLAVRKTDRLVKVFNLVLADQEFYIVGGFQVRSKPPLTQVAAAQPPPVIEALPAGSTRK